MGRVSEEDVKVLSRVLSSLPGGFVFRWPGMARRCPPRFLGMPTNARGAGIVQGRARLLGNGP